MSPYTSMKRKIEYELIILFSLENIVNRKNNFFTFIFIYNDNINLHRHPLPSS